MPAKPGIHRLTDKQATGAKPKAKPYRIADGGGLYLEIAITGRKRWGLRIEQDGKRRDVGGIGVYHPGNPEHVSLASAREKARDIRAKPSAGQTIPTFRAYALAFIETRRPTWKNAVAAAQWPSTLEAYVFPSIGHVSVAEITPTEIRTILAPIWHTKPETAKKVAQRIGAVIDAAIGEELRTRANPVHGVRALLGTQRNAIEHHAAMRWADAPAFIAWLHAECPSEPKVRAAFEWLILTASRVREVLDAPWTEIDRDAGVWRISRERMKRPDPAGAPHEIPLSSRALAILRTAESWRQTTNGLLFPAKRGPLATDVFRMVLLRGDWIDATAHGFRSTFRDWASEQWVSPIADKSAVIEAALDHIPGKVERAYHRSRYLEERRALMQAWADFLAGPNRIVS